MGYFSIAPLRAETIEDLPNQRRYARDLTAADILPYEPGIPVELDGLAVGVRPGVSLSQKREWGMALILGIRQVLVDLGKRGIVITRIWANSSKPDGIRLMRHAGFTETVSAVPGTRDFLIEVEPSGLPFLLEYKAALASYREQRREPSSFQGSATGPDTEFGWEVVIWCGKRYHCIAPERQPRLTW